MARSSAPGAAPASPGAAASSGAPRERQVKTLATLALPRSSSPGAAPASPGAAASSACHERHVGLKQKP